MSDASRNNGHGPTEAEERMLNAYDTFYSLLSSRPVEARKLAYEVETVVKRYELPRKGPQPKQTNERPNQ